MVIPNECVLGCAYRNCTSDFHSEFCPCRPNESEPSGIYHSMADSLGLCGPETPLAISMKPETKKGGQGNLQARVTDQDGTEYKVEGIYNEPRVDAIRECAQRESERAFLLGLIQHPILDQYEKQPVFEFNYGTLRFCVWLDGRVEIRDADVLCPAAVTNRISPLVSSLSAVIRSQAKQLVPAKMLDIPLDSQRRQDYQERLTKHLSQYFGAIELMWMRDHFDRRDIVKSCNDALLDFVGLMCELLHVEGREGTSAPPEGWSAQSERNKP